MCGPNPLETAFTPGSRCGFPERLSRPGIMTSKPDLVRFYSADYIGSDAIPSPVGRLIEREREMHYRAEGAHLETAIYSSLTYRPPGRQDSFLRRLFQDIRDPSGQLRAHSHD